VCSDINSAEQGSTWFLRKMPEAAPPVVAVSEQFLCFGLAKGMIGKRQGAEGDIVGDWLGHQGKAVGALAWIPNEHSFVSGGADGSILLWRGANGATRQLRAAHQDPVTALPVPVTALAVAPMITDGRRLLVSADAKGLVKVTDLEQEPGQIKLTKWPVWGAERDTTSFGNRWVRKGEGYTIQIVRAHDDADALLVLEVEGEPKRLSFSPDGMELAAMIKPPDKEEVFRVWHAAPPK
jgi:WD40 repeat protein